MKKWMAKSCRIFCLYLALTQSCWSDTSDEAFDLPGFSVNVTLGITFVPTTLIGLGSSYISDTRPLEGMFVFKNYAYAQEDAAAYVASKGSIHGVQLERAWQDYNASNPESGLLIGHFAMEVLAWNAPY